MKTIFKPIFYVLLTALLAVSCAKNDDFGMPDIYDCDEPQVAATKTIKEINDVSNTSLKVYDKEDVISGIVVSSDRAGNFYRELHIVSEDGAYAFKLKADIKGSYANYNIGRKVYVKLKNLYTQIDNGLLNIGNVNGNYTGYITNYRAHLLRSCSILEDSEIEKLNNRITIEELLQSDGYLGKLVTLTNVQFEKSTVGKTLYDADDPNNDNGGGTIRYLEDSNGQKVGIRTTQYVNDLKGWVIPDNSGSVTGIMTKFGNNYQFVPRFEEDFKLTEPRLEDLPVEPEEITIVGTLAFPGADFENWNEFLGTLNSFGPENITQAEGQGWENSAALSVNGEIEKTGYLFTVENIKNVPLEATKLSFLLKGTSADRSLSINVYSANGQYVAYNLKDISKSRTISKAIPDSNGYVNDYEGKINTKDQWIKVTLDLTGSNYNTSGKGNLIAFKVGGKTKNIAANYDILIDEVRFEDGIPNDNGGQDPDPDPDPDPQPSTGDLAFPGADFEDWNAFMNTLREFSGSKLKDYATQKPGEGIDDSHALGLVGTPTGNDYVFTVENVTSVPSGKTKLVLWIKGISAKSLSFNIYKNDGTSYTPFNVGSTTADTNISAAANNQYTGTIDTAGNWIKITLDLNDVEYNTSGTGSLFALKVGKDATYDLRIDNIMFE